ncbi:MULTISPECIES: TetR/AcrR family transcriptional regulator [Bacillus]|uniref:Transcriptional regulator, TetR family n=7 Tax=Bacillus cereus group TaxID=86661 RepID=A0A6H3ACD6_BACAN|nr:MULTISPECIES: TetR/AcrR family transcriptional regulator [Bacillus]EJT22375.1 TetR family transcriptional regulator [Bacillus anthracis str. UR-1]EXJ21519.1 TetR family transcriptional regulator [Bacillus anthracis str. 95014]AAP25000.1 transcriptional regulator, TetR family [Bacillus anthracis str. Ames]AAT30116.1 transcriptional regulator, TetR family [Bacillus anthracis str. 'Ames Ancestor']AAT53273.1 transcriptional regulator, TetR family [Bacillus anthracis str. Sterne]
MGRKISFNKERALNKAMHLFWEKGYDATYISDLIETMGISRSTLYDSFGDKDALFKLVLEQYKNYGSQKRNLLFSDTNTKESLKSFFYQHIEKCYSDDIPKGCIITNSSLLIGQIDPSIEEILINDFNELEKAFKQVIEEGKKKGEISQEDDTELVAYSLLSLNHSLNLMSMYKKEKKLAYNLVDKAIADL